MEQQQFNLRFDGPTLAALKRLARATQRSQAGVIRWLILAEAERLPASASAQNIGGDSEMEVKMT